MIDATLNDLGRTVCIQMMERVFGLKFDGFGGTDADPSKEPTTEPDSTVH